MSAVLPPIGTHSPGFFGSEVNLRFFFYHVKHVSPMIPQFTIFTKKGSPEPLQRKTATTAYLSLMLQHLNVH